MAAVASIAAGLSAGLTGAQAAGPSGWRAVARITAPGRNGVFFSVAAASPGAAWAAGGTGHGDNVSGPLLARWSAGAWRRVNVPSGVLAKLGSNPVLGPVTASSPANVWVFTVEDDGWLHWNGTTWSSGHAIDVDIINAGLATGRHGAWIFGTNLVQAGERPYAAIRSGQGWHRTSVPGRGGFAAASAVSSTDIWAVLGNGQFATPPSPAGSLVHWSHGRWQEVTSLPAALRTQWLGSVLARSDRNVWVGGGVANGRGGTTEAIGHFNGKSWTVIRLRAKPTAAPFFVSSIVPDGAGGLWALGLCDYINRCPAQPDSAWRLWHLTGGRWIGPVTPHLGGKIRLLFALAAAGHSVWGAGVAGSSLKHPAGLIALWGAAP